MNTHQHTRGYEPWSSVKITVKVSNLIKQTSSYCNLDWKKRPTRKEVFIALDHGSPKFFMGKCHTRYCRLAHGSPLEK